MNRYSILQLPKCRHTGIAYIKLDGAFYSLSEEDADWAMQDSTSSAEFGTATVGVRSSDIHNH